MKKRLGRAMKIASILLVTMLIVVFVALLISYAGDSAKRMEKEKEYTAWVALQYAVDDTVANEAAQQFKYLVADDSFAGDRIRAIIRLKEIDGGYYFRIYLNDEKTAINVLSSQTNPADLVDLPKRPVFLKTDKILSPLLIILGGTVLLFLVVLLIPEKPKKTEPRN